MRKKGWAEFMLRRNALSEKVFVLGVDGLDPKLAKKYLQLGIMPNLQKIIDRGACREDLVLLGAHPTITPPMWTTLSTGAYANTHTIYGFYKHKTGTPLDTLSYALNSDESQAEPLWNCFAEAGRKTLVWHWPGCSWPPTSDSENLIVVDGSSPGSVGHGKLAKDHDFLVEASVMTRTLGIKKAVETEGAAACVMELDEDVTGNGADGENSFAGSKLLIMNEKQQTGAFTEADLDIVQSPIVEASNWGFEIPENSREFTLIYSDGMVRRSCLIVKNESGLYDKVLIYKTKKEESLMATLLPNEFTVGIVDDGYKGNNKYDLSRNIKILELKEDGSYLKLYVSPGMDINNDSIYSPRSLKDELYTNIGYVPSSTMIGNQNPQLITDCMLANWDIAVDWQAKALNYMIEKHGVEAIFSHMHNVDLQMHLFVMYMSGRRDCRLPQEMYEKFAQDVYKQTDRYLGEFVHLLDEGWTIFVVSDHAQVSHKHEIPFLCDPSGLNVRVMQELGYTVLKKDENGNDLPEVDWSKTRAAALGELQIYINLKGRDPEGIVDPADKYDLEEQIITDLYGYRDKETGHRVVAVALRNKDAILLGEGGPEAGDICYWLAEGYTFDHGDTLSTACEGDTSVSPIFVAAGQGIKAGYITERVIRQVDVTPTVAVVGGVRMPRQCEGAPVYQILTEEY